MFEKNSHSTYRQEKLWSVVGLNVLVGSVALLAVLTQANENLTTQPETIVPAHPDVIEKAPTPNEIITTPADATITPAPSP